MTDQSRVKLLAFLGLLFLAALFIHVRLSMAMEGEETVWREVRYGPTPTLENLAPYEHALALLAVWRAVVGGAAILSLGALVFLHQRRTEGPRVWTRAAGLGLVSILIAVGLILSTLKQGFPDEQRSAMWAAPLALSSGGLLCGAGLLAWVTGRIGPRIVGTILILLVGLVFVALLNYR